MEPGKHRSRNLTLVYAQHSAQASLLYWLDQLLGNTEKHAGEEESFAGMRMTSHIEYIRLEQRLSDHWEFRFQGRVGKRLYNDAFHQRNTTFWTIGPHIFWRATDHLKLFIAYHYERGLADGRQEVEAEEDFSYVHQFFAVGCDAELMPHLELELDFHYERNNFTSGIPEDERKADMRTSFWEMEDSSTN